MRLKTNIELLEEFCRVFQKPVNDISHQITDEEVRFHTNLIIEEFNEMIAELWQSTLRIVTKPEKGFQPDKLKLAKEMADLLYVIYHAAITFGIPLDEVFKEVHKSNMSKLGDDGKPIFREDGKVMKGPNYKLPNLEKVLYGSKDEKPLPFFV